MLIDWPSVLCCERCEFEGREQHDAQQFAFLLWAGGGKKNPKQERSVIGQTDTVATGKLVMYSRA